MSIETSAKKLLEQWEQIEWGVISEKRWDANRTALYEKAMSQIEEEKNEFCLWNKAVRELSRVKTSKDKGMEDRARKGWAHVATLAEMGSSEDLLKALELLGTITDYLARPHSMFELQSVKGEIVFRRKDGN